MAVVLREEVSLLEVELGEVVVAYVEHLEREASWSSTSATEFLVLIASLLELKSRLLLPGAEEELEEIGPEEAVEELLARLLEYRRYRDAAAVLERALRGRARLPLPLGAAAAGAAPGRARRGHRRLRPRAARRRARRPAGEPPDLDISHIRPTVSLERRLRALRDALRGRASIDFDEQFGGEDRLTQAVTLFALLELTARARRPGSRASPSARSRSTRRRAEPDERPDPHDRSAALPLAAAGQRARPGRGDRGDRGPGRRGDRRCCARTSPRASAASSCARSPAASPWPATRPARPRRGACWPSRGRRR